jgi:hypothetical protein
MNENIQCLDSLSIWVGTLKIFLMQVLIFRNKLQVDYEVFKV